MELAELLFLSEYITDEVNDRLRRGIHSHVTSEEILAWIHAANDAWEAGK